MAEEKGIASRPGKRGSESPSGINHLLVIAIDNYQYCEGLNNCVSDARELIRLLTQRYRFDPERLQTLFNEEATRDNIYEKVEDLSRRVGERDSLLIYFSGHGDIRVDKNGNPEAGFWIPADARPGKRADYIGGVELVDLLNSIHCFHLFVIVDACFAGSLFRHYRSEGDIGDDNRKSRLGLASSHSREKAFDGKPGDSSPFARILLSELENAKGSMGAERLSVNVKEKLMREEIGQKPVFRTLDVEGDDGGQFIFYPRGENTFLDPRDFKLYRTVETGGLTWLVENLDFDAGEGCWHYLEDANIGKSFGRLYTWEAALRACPPGWRLPMDEDWKGLIRAMGGSFDPETLQPRDSNPVYQALMEGGKSGFSARWGGWRSSAGVFHSLGDFGSYWTATEQDEHHAIYYLFGRMQGQISRIPDYKTEGCSCRYVREATGV